MTDRTFDRRGVVRLMATAGAAGVAAQTMGASAAQAAGTAAYDPTAKFDIDVKDARHLTHIAAALRASRGASAPRSSSIVFWFCEVGGTILASSIAPASSMR